MIGYRKLIAGGIVLGLGVGAALKWGDIPANLNQLLEFLFGSFVVGNGFEHASDAYAGPDSQEAVQSEPINLDEVHTRLDNLQAATQAIQTQNEQLQAAASVTNGGIQHIIVKGKLT